MESGFIMIWIFYIKHLYGYNYTLRQLKLATWVQHNMPKVHEALMSDPLGAQDVDYEVFAKCFYSARRDPIREDDIITMATLDIHGMEFMMLNQLVEHYHKL
jgi:hypothetical protein